MKAFKTSRQIPASPERIFEALSNPSKLAAWWGPAGFTNTFNVFEFEKGGKWSFVMHGPGGKHYPNESEFLDIVDLEKVVIGHLSEPKFTLTITITGAESVPGVGSGSLPSSTVDWLQVFDSADVASSVAPIVVPSNEQNLDRLTSVVCGGSQVLP